MFRIRQKISVPGESGFATTHCVKFRNQILEMSLFFRENLSLKVSLEAAERELEKARGAVERLRLEHLQEKERLRLEHVEEKELLERALDQEREERKKERKELVSGQLLAALRTYHNQLPPEVRQVIILNFNGYC